jgi:hypothetical protein
MDRLVEGPAAARRIAPPGFAKGGSRYCYRLTARCARHSSAVISHISLRRRPLTYFRYSMATTRMPLFSDILRDGALAMAFVVEFQWVQFTF